MRITPQRATLWADAYAAVMRVELPRMAAEAAAAHGMAYAPDDPAALWAHCRERARLWLILRERGHHISSGVVVTETAKALGLPDAKPQTIRNFLRGL